MNKSYTNDDFDSFLLDKPDNSSEMLSESNEDSDGEQEAQAQ
jgi:hypothetical protein